MGRAWDYAHMPEGRKSDEKQALRQLLLARIEDRRDLFGFTDNEISLAGGNRYIMRDLRGRGSIPAGEKLAGIAQLLGVSTDWLMGRTDDPTPPDVPSAVELTHAPAVGDVSRTFRRAPQNLPVHGTALGHNLRFDEDGTADVEVTLYDPGSAIHYVTRPPALFNNDTAYAIYVQGDSMAPAHKDGALRVVNPRAPLRVGDDVVVQLHASDGDEGQEVVSALIKTLVRRSASFVVLQQLNPAREFRVPVERIAAIHRVMDLADLLG